MFFDKSWEPAVSVTVSLSVTVPLSVTPLARLLKFSYVVIFDYLGKQNWHVSDPQYLFQKSSHLINSCKHAYFVFLN